MCLDERADSSVSYCMLFFIKFFQIKIYIQYGNWADSEPKQNCKADEALCAYYETTANEKNWKTGSCLEPDAFACMITAGQSIHPIPKPDYNKHCENHLESEFQFIYNHDDDKCFLFPRQGRLLIFFVLNCFGLTLKLLSFLC